MKQQTRYKWLVTIKKGTEEHKYHYTDMFSITEDLYADLHRYLQKGYTVTIEKIA